MTTTQSPLNILNSSLCHTAVSHVTSTTWHHHHHPQVPKKRSDRGEVGAWRAWITNDWGAKRKREDVCVRERAEERQPSSSCPTSASSNLSTSRRMCKTDWEKEEEMKGAGKLLELECCWHQRTDWCRCHGATRWAWRDCTINPRISVLSRAAFHHVRAALHSSCWLLLLSDSFEEAEMLV